MTDTLPPSTSTRPVASRHPLAPLFNAGTVSLRCAQVLQSVRNNLSAHFRVDAAALQRLADQVQQHLLQASPSGQSEPGAVGDETAALAVSPFWQHLQAGGTNRLAEFSALLAGQSPAEQARAWADLAFIGVLMSADPGPRWRCSDQHTLPTAAFAQAQAEDLLALLDRAGKTALPQAQPAGGTAAQAGSSGAADAAGAIEATARTALEDATATATASANLDGPAPAPAPTPAPAPAAAPVAAPVDAPAPTPPLASGARFGGAEGLAIAIYRAFVAGAFSSNRAQPCRADAAVLRHIDVAALRAILQGTPQNPLQGLEGRAAVLARLGQLLQALPGAGAAAARPADLVAALQQPPAAAPGVPAGALLADLARKTAALWATAPVQGLPAGDVWQHLWAGAAVGHDVGSGVGATTSGSQAPQAAGSSDRITSGWVPLLAVPQALVAALALPLARAGQPLLGQEALTACADEPTSALMMAAGVVVPRHARLLSRSLKPGDEAMVECRALTVALFDELAARVRTALQPGWGAAAARLPVAQVAKAAAAVLAGSGAPALRLESDGALL